MVYVGESQVYGSDLVVKLPPLQEYTHPPLMRLITSYPQKTVRGKSQILREEEDQDLMRYWEGQEERLGYYFSARKLWDSLLGTSVSAFMLYCSILPYSCCMANVFVNTLKCAEVWPPSLRCGGDFGVHPFSPLNTLSSTINICPSSLPRSLPPPGRQPMLSIATVNLLDPLMGSQLCGLYQAFLAGFHHNGGRTCTCVMSVLGQSSKDAMMMGGGWIC